MATFSKKLGGKEVGPASTYAEPHTMTGKALGAPNVGSESQQREFKNLVVSAGNMRTQDYSPVKTSGIKVRGIGAATKGTMARGPMA